MMKKNSFLLLVLSLFVFALAACSESGAEGDAGSDADETSSDAGNAEVIEIVWYPNESGNDMKGSRDAIGEIVKEATGKEVEHHLTTDYAIAIETLINNNAAMAFMGAVGYIEANTGNDSVQPLVVPTGPSGTLDDAIYYSWLAVDVDRQDEFKVDGEFSLDTIADQRMSFVSNSSTSGFVVPSTSIIEYFADSADYGDLTQEDLMEGGALFSQVLFGNSHQGSAVNLINGSADVAAFCDTCVDNYVEVIEGEENTVGAVYAVKEDAEDPFTNLPGEEFILMSVTPVLNAPIAGNLDVLSEEEFAKIQEALASDEVANNEEIFVPDDSEASGLFSKSADERFVIVEDDWFNPIRELSN